MDAAHKLLKITGILLAIALIMAAPGWAQPTLNVPTSVALSGTGGQTANVTSSGAPATQITYSIGTPQYANDNNGQAFVPWLGVSGGTTTPATLNFSLISTTGLIQGTHTATVTLTPTDASGAAAQTITVTYSSGNP